MIPSMPGYEDEIDFTGYRESRDHFGLISRDGIYYISCVNNGSRYTCRLTATEAGEIQDDWDREGLSPHFIEKWINDLV